MIQLNNIKASVTNSSSSNYYDVFYNFNKKLSTGFDPTNTSYNTNKMLPLETDSYGIIGEVTGKFTVKLRVYNNTGKTAVLENSYIENACTSLDGTWFKNKLALNKDITLDLSTLPTVEERLRFWVVRATLKIDKSDINVWTFICTNIDETWLCAKTSETYTVGKLNIKKFNREKLINKFTNINPKDELAVLGFMHYPRPDFDQPAKYHDETQEWVNLAKSINVSGMSDDRKVWTAYEWVNNNIAYDYWLMKEDGTGSGKCGCRARFANDWAGKYDTYQTKCAVCWGMANIMTIFCRTWNIPAVVLSNNSHAWCAVYLNNRWVEFDCTKTNKYAVKTEDVTNRMSDAQQYGYLTQIGQMSNVTKDINASLACCPGWSDLSKSYLV